MDDTPRIVELLTDIRGLLLLMAEPQLEAGDKVARERLRALVGKSKKLQDSVGLMDGSNSRPDIQKKVPIDQGQLSRFIKALQEEALFDESEGRPRMSIYAPATIFQVSG